MGVINPIDHERIQLFLEEQYVINRITSLHPSHEGCDNTVYFAQSDILKKILYTVKIYETKTSNEVSNTLSVVEKYNIEAPQIIKNTKGKILSLFDQKPFLVYHFIEGNPLTSKEPDINKASTLLAKLHKQQEVINSPIEEVITQEFELIKNYFSKEVQGNVPTQRLETYTHFFDFIKTYKEKSNLLLASTPPLFGLCHGDAHGANIVEKLDKNYNFIDFDNISENSFQILDIVNLLSKKSYPQDINYIRNFLSQYFHNRNMIITMDTVEESIHMWMIIYATRALLSTDYYTYSIKKLTPQWVEKNIQFSLQSLQNIVTFYSNLFIEKWTKNN